MKVGDLVKIRYDDNRTGVIVKVYDNPKLKIGNVIQTLNEDLYDVLKSDGEILHLATRMGLEVISESR